MSQLKQVVDPFGEVNVHPAGDKVRVVATILMQPHKEGAQTGIALDGSGSMRKLYGLEGGGKPLSAIFAAPKQTSNDVTPVARKICSYLARNLDADGGTTCIYWAVGPGGSQVEIVGDFTADEAERHTFGPPRDFGTGTQLLPAVRYFIDRFKTAPWGFYVFVTDGELHDLEEVIAYSKKLAQDIATGRRHPVKLVLIGIGPDVAEYQMEALDDLEAPVDLWDHKLASEMRVLEEIFAEVVDKNARVADHGRILDPRGQVVKNYSDTGLPAYLDFEMPADAKYFTLEVNGAKIHQSLADGFQPPAPAGAPKAQAQQPTAAAAKPKEPEIIDALPVEDVTGADAEWKSLPLEFGQESPADKPDVDLERHEE